MGQETAYTTLLAMLLLGTSSFILALSLSPLLSRALIRYRCWKKKVRTIAPDGSKTEIFARLHKDKETNTPRMAGVLIWGTTLFVAFALRALSAWTDWRWADAFDFVSRGQTWVPLFTLASASLLGFADDLLVVRDKGESAKGGGITFRRRLALVFLIGLVGAYWFYVKLGWNSIHIPFLGDTAIGWLYVPLFILMVMGVFSTSVVDGLDGLAGGLFVIMYGAYASIAFIQGQPHIAIFCAVVAGSILAFLWFNIPPARFYMGETGIMGLTSTLAVVAFFTDTVLLLPIIGSVLVIEALSVIIQLTSKRLRGKKVFLVAPIHHHFEAKGWPAYQVTMRFWLIGGVSALLGIALLLLDLRV